MELLIMGLAVLTFVSTLIGGFVILRFRGSLPFFFAFAAGSLVAVSFLDILPETLSLSASIAFPVRYVMIVVVVSFFVYSAINKLVVTHSVGKECDRHGHIMGPLGAGSLVIHSFLDGIAIGTAFKIGAAVGLLVALAVILHDFTDGMNTVTLMLKNRQKLRRTVYFLVMDALAPVLGVGLIYFLSIPENILVVILAFFVGEFVYLGAATLLPETGKYSSGKTLAAMGLAIILIAVLTSLI